MVRLCLLHSAFVHLKWSITIGYVRQQPMATAVAASLQTRCPSRHLTNSTKCNYVTVILFQTSNIPSSLAFSVQLQQQPKTGEWRQSDGNPYQDQDPGFLGPDQHLSQGWAPTYHHILPTCKCFSFNFTSTVLVGEKSFNKKLLLIITHQPTNQPATSSTWHHAASAVLKIFSMDRKLKNITQKY